MCWLSAINYFPSIVLKLHSFPTRLSSDLGRASCRERVYAQPAHNEPPPLCYSSTWLSMNVLVLDPKTVCVEKSEVYQAEQLDKLGMEVVPVELRDAYAFGGGLHCCTADVYREGTLKDYFPKQ